MARTWKIYVWTIVAFNITWLASHSMAALASHDNSLPGSKPKSTNSSSKVGKQVAGGAAGGKRAIARGGVFPVGSALKSSSRAAQENEYYSYEYSDEPLATDNNNSAPKSEAAIWLQGVVPDPETLKVGEEVDEQILSEDQDEDVELPENSLADGDLHDHDMMDSVMFIYFGPNEQENGGTSSQVVLAGMAVALLAQGLTAFGALRKVARSRCRSTPSAGIPSGSVHAAIVLLHTELALATASLVFIFAVHSTMESARCEAISLLLHYLHLSAACWLTANSVRVYLWLARETSLERAPSSSRPPGLQSLAVIAWALPLLLVFLSYVVHPRGYEFRRYCWLSIQKGMLVSYLVPVAFLITATTALAVLGVRKAPHKLHSSAAEDAARLCLRLSAWTMPLFAVSWFFSVLALEQSQSVAASLLFALTAAIFNWLVFACSSTLFPDCPTSLVRNFHPLAMPVGGGGGGGGGLMPPSPLQHDAQPLLPAAAPAACRGWNPAPGWTPRSHPELPSPAQRAWGDDGAGAVGSASLAASVAASMAADDEMIEAEETSELLELRLENISTIST